MLAYAQVVTRSVTRIHDLDFGFWQDFVPFAFVGLGFGGLLGIADAYINTRVSIGAGRVPTWGLASAIWGVFVLPTLLLTLIQPERFKFSLWQHVQGLVFIVFLGLVYGGLKTLDGHKRSGVTS